MGEQADEFLRSLGIPLLRDEVDQADDTDTSPQPDGDADHYQNDADATVRRLSEMAAVLANERTTFHADDDMARVVVDGNAAIRDLHLAPGAHQQQHPEKLASTLVDLLARARSDIQNANSDQMQQALTGSSSALDDSDFA